MVYLDWVKASLEPGFRRLFYFTSPDHLCENLNKAKVKISKFGKCNDIFELASFDLRSHEVRRRHSDWVARFSNSVGLICLSEDWRNQLMWGHYTKGGTGVCLVFDVKTDNLKKVTYLAERKTVAKDYEFPEDCASTEFLEACSIKSNHWMYESEQRYITNLQNHDHVISDDDGNHFLLLNDDFRLVGFINGPKPKKSASEIQNYFRGDLKFFQCRASFKEFKMVVQQDVKLWK